MLMRSETPAVRKMSSAGWPSRSEREMLARWVRKRREDDGYEGKERKIERERISGRRGVCGWCVDSPRLLWIRYDEKTQSGQQGAKMGRGTTVHSSRERGDVRFFSWMPALVHVAVLSWQIIQAATAERRYLCPGWPLSESRVRGRFVTSRGESLAESLARDGDWRQEGDRNEASIDSPRDRCLILERHQLFMRTEVYARLATRS
ncbi:hypothetical protein K438DRAFT_1758199 [Mycena galopus ATCC 62051]|nr:hypothetical protein K438DRAFT_1758199 [Mycena galopus ATCC 62051]